MSPVRTGSITPTMRPETAAVKYIFPGNIETLVI
jgi:hypothetical protein